MNCRKLTIGALTWATLILVAAGCGGSRTAGRPLQRVRIVAQEGPGMSTCQAGRHCERPYRGPLVLITATGHREAITTGTRGRTFLDIPAGEYRITTPRAHPLPRLTRAIVAGRRVSAVNGRLPLRVRLVPTQTVALFFDTGIR